MSLIKLYFEKFWRKETLPKFDESTHYFNEWSHTYDKYTFRYFMRRAQRNSINMISNKNFSALDVSCGTGEGLLMLREKTSGRIAGVDISEEMLKIAKKKVGGKNIELKKGSVDKLIYDDETFDVVISTEAFHHYPNPENAVKEMTRVLKKGGELIITDPDFLVFNRLFEKIEPGCVHIYNKREMKNLFIQAGLNDIKQRRTAIAFFITKGVK